MTEAGAAPPGTGGELGWSAGEHELRGDLTAAFCA